MKVKDFRKMLEIFDDEDIILMSKDAEGNRFNHVAEISDFQVMQRYEYSCNDWGCPGCNDEHVEYMEVEDVPEDVKEHQVVMIWPY